MEIVEKKEIGSITSEMATVVTHRYVEADGELRRLDDDFVQVYRNFAKEREEMEENEQEEILNAIYAIWGDAPAITVAGEEGAAGDGAE